MRDTGDAMTSSLLTRVSGLAALGLLVVGLSGCAESASAPTDPAEVTAQPAAVTVRTAAVTATDSASDTLRFAGIVQAHQRATLTFQVSGTLKAQPVEMGQQVKAGDLLARLYNPALKPATDSAKARLQELTTQLEQAQREWKRSQSLYQRGVVSEQTLEQLAAKRDGLEASVATAEASLAEANQMLGESTLKAPFAGRIEALLVEVDEFVGAGTPVVRLSSPGRREVEVRVPAYMLEDINLGQLLPIWSVQNRHQEPVNGTVVEIAQPGSVRGELHAVLVSLPENTLDAGAPVEVGIIPRVEPVTTVPLLSVIRSATGTAVYRVSTNDGTGGSKAERVAVDVRRIVGEQVVIESDALKAGDQVVYAGMTRLADGDPLEILP